MTKYNHKLKQLVFIDNNDVKIYNSNNYYSESISGFDKFIIQTIIEKQNNVNIAGQSVSFYSKSKNINYKIHENYNSVWHQNNKNNWSWLLK